MAIDPTAPVTAMISGKMNEAQSRDEQKRGHRYNKEYMSLSHMYEMASAYKSPQITKQGLMAAGLSPALMSEGMFAPATAPTSPSAPSPAPSRYNLQSLGIGEMFQLQNLKAQTDNIKANTESVEIKNDQERDANATAVSLAETMFDKLAESAHTPKEQEYYKFLADTARTKSSFELVSKLIDNLDKKELYDMHYQQYLLGEKVAYLQAYDDDVLTKLAKLPSQEYAQLGSMVKYYTEYAEKLKADKSLSEQDKELRLQQIKLTKEQVNNLVAATKRINDTNLMKIAEDVGNGKEPVSKLLAAIAFLVLGNVSTHF